MLSLTCYLLGDDVKRYFVVEIEETKAVSILKDLIKEKKAPHLDHVSASDLEIWKVDLPILNLKDGLDEIELNDDNSLSQHQRLSEVFSNLVSGHLHVIAKAPGTSRQSSLSEPLLTPLKVQTAAALDPTQLLCLNCFLLGDDFDRMFTVEIPKNKNVSILKSLIKKEKAPHLDHVAASDIDLGKVSIPIDDEVGERLENIDNLELLKPHLSLSHVFPHVEENHLHVVVRINGELSEFFEQRRTWSTFEMISS